MGWMECKKWLSWQDLGTFNTGAAVKESGKQEQERLLLYLYAIPLEMRGSPDGN